MITSINEFAKKQQSKPSYKVIAELENCIAVEYHGFNTVLIFKNDLHKLIEKDFSNVNLMNNYFTGTAVIGKQDHKIRRSTTDYSDPFHKGQVIPDKKESEQFSDDEEFDFKYDNQMSSTMINKLLDIVIPQTYVKGTVVKKVYLG